MRETQHACSTVPSFSPCLLLFLLYGKFPYAFELLVSFPQKDFFMEIRWSLDFLNFKKLLESLGHSKMLSSLHPVQKREDKSCPPACEAHIVSRVLLSPRSAGRSLPAMGRGRSAADPLPRSARLPAQPWAPHSQSQWGLFMLLPLMNFKALFSPLLFYFYLNYCNLVCSHVKHFTERIFFSNSFLQAS